MLLLVCDANVWIEASKSPQSPSAQMLTLGNAHGLRFAISKHTRSELAAGSSDYGPAAEALAAGFEELPYYPIGCITQLLGTIAELSGTFDDMRRNEQVRDSLATIATQGTDIRDRGALIDAIRNDADFFVTYDTGIVGTGPDNGSRARWPCESERRPKCVQ